MNIYESVYKQNISHPNKRALSVTMNNGDRRIYTYGEVFQKAELYSKRLAEAGVQAGDRIAFVSDLRKPEMRIWRCVFCANFM